MNYLSVCSGIEAATVAWHDLGFKPVGFSEIEKFPSQLLQHHYPHVTNYGDMTNYKEWNLNESIGLLVGGTPCQSFSVAGLRKGLEDPRGNLMLTYLGIAEKFKPKWLLWENVPGVLSSNGGEDFACLLKGMAELGYGFAYRVFDAQHFGVPQRRKRVFVVGCIGDWRSAAKVLFESESLSRDITPSRQEGKEIANCIKASPSSYGSYNPARSEGNAVVVGTLLARDHKGIDNYDHTKMILQRSVGAIDLKDVSKTLTASYGTGGADLDIKPLVLESKAYNITFCDANGTRKDRPNGGLYVNETDTSNTLTVSGVGTNAVQNMRVRRLTPMECERLQGFPDGYTHTPTSSDTTRYKALGNSMAVPVMRWIGKRISQL
jgi:DNA (cytosine-5)-methyltransferase 1